MRMARLAHDFKAIWQAKEKHMRDESYRLRRKLLAGRVSRRHFIRGVAGAAGAGIVLGAARPVPARAQAAHPICPVVPRPIPHTSTPPGAHFFFPGPVDATPITSDTGHDPSIITDFQGTVAEADLTFSGTGTDLKTGKSATYDFHCDMRFMDGVFVGLDNEVHQGTIGFI
jgi:hypothetical protein